jgi:hypothetical protein
VWGDHDQLGTLNLPTDQRTRRAAALVRRGAVFPRNLPLHEPQPQLAWRTPPTTTSCTSAARHAAGSPATPMTPPAG